MCELKEEDEVKIIESDHLLHNLPIQHTYCHRGETTYAMGWLKWGMN
jgi:hypothetical protein